MKKDVCLFMYSHSSYSDAWRPFIKQADKHMAEYKKYIFCDDADNDLVPENWNIIYYNNEDSYSNRIATCLEKVQEPICIYHHEDMFLYDEPDKLKLSKYEDIVYNDNIDFIRLLRSVDPPEYRYKKESLFVVPNYSQYFFSVQPTICKTNVLLEICKSTKIEHLREFEIKVQETCRQKNIKGLFHYSGEEKIGDHHYDSDVYPYIATAIVKGKWNISGYPNKLKRLLKLYNIDSNLRGTI